MVNATQQLKTRFGGGVVYSRMVKTVVGMMVNGSA